MFHASNVLSRIVASIWILKPWAGSERLGDLATNISEEIIFMEQGEIVRYQTEDKRLTLSLKKSYPRL
jgi:hypothetical protein